jgi:hypothetical protein
MNKELISIADNIVQVLKSNGFVIHRYDAHSTNSIYLKLDYGVCNSIRISDHSGKKYLKYRYNVIWNGDEKQEQDTYERFYFNQKSLDKMINKIISDRNQKIERYGQLGYDYFMKKNNEDNHNKKGFWKQAKLI